MKTEAKTPESDCSGSLPRRAQRRARVGFIGAGAFISAHHLLTARDSRIMTVHAIADLDQKNLRAHESRFSPSYTTSDYRRILSDPQIDIVVVGTKDDLHAPMIVESLDAGKWVFCEKPMAETQDQAEAVLAAERRSTGKLAVGFNRRFSPAYLDAKRLMQKTPRPWFINYRLMAPNPEKQKKNFYAGRERILYEGTHILDLACWFLDAKPSHVFMSGDRYLNNCCILEFPDGSHVSFMCGSIGSYCLWKEYMECFSKYCSITVSEFTDMRVRGLPGEYDRLYPPHLHEHGDEVMKYGFDFFEIYRVEEFWREEQARNWWKENGLSYEEVRRPIPVPFDVSKFSAVNADFPSLLPDKGWVSSLEHFAGCYLDGTQPHNADGRAGALSTQVALALLKSLETGRRIEV